MGRGEPVKIQEGQIDRLRSKFLGSLLGTGIEGLIHFWLTATSEQF